MAMARSIYLDHSATTPTDPRVVEVMLPYFTQHFGNPVSVHQFGRQAESAIETARERIAHVLNCLPSEVIFTSGASESNNLALRGSMRAGDQRPVLTTRVEHHAVSRTAAEIGEVEWLPVDSWGRASVEDVERTPSARLVSLMYANNEVGTIHDLAGFAEAAHEIGAYFHTDAVQAGGQLPLDVNALGVDMLSLSAHKFYGPKGVGLLYARKGVELHAVQTGGSHERGLRAGTHNTPLIVGMAWALELATTEYEFRVKQLTARRDELIDGVLSRIPDVRLTGHPTERLPSHASFVIDGAESNTLLMHLDLLGVAASSGSACKTGNPEPSDVLLAMGYTPTEALTGLRLTVGLSTTQADIEYAVDALVRTVEKVRKVRDRMVIA
ncbi:MAG TPA: cysteine desulfurase family protein [Aggregatilineales bacterium]|nr:cysteine desulfurase family protein [Aggregatilineales bacterium]